MSVSVNSSRSRLQDADSTTRSLSDDARWRIPHVLMFLYLATKPFYFSASGLPQIADGFLVLLMVHTVVSRRPHRAESPWSNRLVLLTVGFAYWSTLVNVVAAITVGHASSFMISSAMNIYNAAIVVALFTVIVDHGKSIVKSLYWGAIASVSLQLVIIFSGVASTGVRAAGTFNNPNQLAFHALLVLAIIIVSHHLIAPPVWLTITGGLAAMACISVSLSRSGLLAAALILLGAAIWPPGERADRRNFRLLYVLMTLPLLAVALATDVIRSSAWYDIAYARATKVEPAGFETNRGYDRIIDHSEYWLFGAGDGHYLRFGPHEFHSTLGNIQLSYGIVGLILYLCILYAVLRGRSARFWYVVAGVVVYGLAHNGLRSSIAWMVLVLVMFVAKDGFEALRGASPDPPHVLPDRSPDARRTFVSPTASAARARDVDTSTRMGPRLVL